MSTVYPLINFLFQQLDYDQQAMLVVNGDHEVLRYTDKFKDMWQLSQRVLRSRNELSGLKEAMKRVDRPQFFYDRVLRTYQSNVPVSNIEVFRTGKTVTAHYHPFKINRRESIIVWLCETDEIVNRDKTNVLDSLTPREKEALYHYLFGYTVKVVAAKLKNRKRTAESQVQSIKDKLDCRTRDELIDLARAWGLINILFI